MRGFLDALAGLCRDHPLAVKWVLVRGHALGHTLADRLARETGTHVNLRFRTPFDLALEIAAPRLLARGIAPMPTDLGPSLVLRLLTELPPDVPRHFRTLPPNGRLGEALWATLREVRLEGLSAQDLLAHETPTPTPTPRGREVAALVAAYEAHLAKTRTADEALVLLEAIESPSEGPVGPGDVAVSMPGVAWPGLVRRFVDSLPVGVVTPGMSHLPGLAMPRRWQAAGAPAVCVDTGANGLGAAMADPVARMRRWLTPMAGPVIGGISLCKAGGREAEIEEVFRRIVSARVPLDEVVVACGAADAATMAWEKAQRQEWPVTLTSGLSATRSRPGRAALAWVRWIEDDFAAARLESLLRSGDLAVDWPAGLSAGYAASILSRAGATWGRDTYSRNLTAEAESERVRAAEPDIDEATRARRLARADAATEVAAWVTKLVADIPDAGDAVMIAPLAGAARAFVERATPTVTELDRAGRAALLAAFADLGALGPLETSWTEALLLLRGAIEGVRILADRPRPGALHVTSLARAAESGRSEVYFVGLEEGRLFPGALEDAVLPDASRARLSPGLARADDRVDEAVAATITSMVDAAAEALGRPGGHLTCSYSCRDLREYRETLASWVLVQWARVAWGEPGLAHSELAERLGDPVSIVPSNASDALTDGGWWLPAAVRNGPAASAALRAARPSLDAGARADAARASDAFTEYDGWVPAAGAVVDPRATGRPMSPTSLERFAGCPFQQFLHVALGIEGIEERERHLDAWLDGMTRGALLHDVYAQTLRHARDSALHPGSAALARHARGVLAALVQQYRDDIPPPSEMVFAREVAQLELDAELFLRLEAERGHRARVGFEVAFGLPSDSSEEPLAREAPVEIPVSGGTLRLRGRIDRIDRVADHEYEILDYKTGRFFEADYEGTFVQGRCLQHVLYAMAAEQILREGDPIARVVAAHYVFPTRKGEAHVETRRRPGDAAAVAVLSAMLDVMRAGAFLQARRESACRICDVAAVCQAEPWDDAKRKFEGEKGSMLRALKDLAGHE